MHDPPAGASICENIQRGFVATTFSTLFNKVKCLSSRPESINVKMAPQKKNKKDANSINSKLALVMKSGKGKKLQQSRYHRRKILDRPSWFGVT